mgnify:CR=1 FL=1
MAARYFALISGVLFIALGIFGFIPGMVATPGTAGPALVVNAGYGYLLKLFPINVLHNIVHLAVGAWGLASHRSYIRSRSYARGLAIFYGILTVMGLLPAPLYTIGGLIPLFGHDVWLHALTALIAAYFGFSRPNPATLREHERELSARSGRPRKRFF